MYCKLPHNGIIIQPNGDIGICCSQNTAWNIGNISEVDDLSDVWKNHQSIIKLREDDTKEMSKACGGCLRSKPPVSLNRWWQINESFPGNEWYRRIPIDGEIRFLEFTTSNICNQSCTTCSSFYSSKWKQLEDEAVEINLPLNEWKNHHGGFNSFGYETYRMSESDIEKIFKLLPDLYLLYVKGGEPFADNNNYIVLEELKRVNPKCHVHITSNMSKIPDKYLKLFKGMEYININCSIDGINETYEYVRSTPFDQTVENIKRWHSAKINSNINVNCNISAHSMYNLKDYFEYFSNNLLEEIKHISIKGWVKNPSYVSPLYLYDEKEIDDYLDELQRVKKHKKINAENLFYGKRLPFDVSQEIREKEIERFHKYTQFMNYKRSMDIYKIHNQLLFL